LCVYESSANGNVAVTNAAASNSSVANDGDAGDDGDNDGDGDEVDGDGDGDGDGAGDDGDDGDNDGERDGNGDNDDDGDGGDGDGSISIAQARRNFVCGSFPTWTELNRARLRLGLIIAECNHKIQRYRFRADTKKIITFRGFNDGFIRRSVNTAAKSVDHILRKWESLVPAGNDLPTTTLSMLLGDVNNAIEDYAAIGGLKGVQALLGLLRNLNLRKKRTGLFQDEGGGGGKREGGDRPWLGVFWVAHSYSSFWLLQMMMFNAC